MGRVTTFGIYSVARMGIYSSQKAMEVTGNNIANISTEGYTRQSVDQISLNMGGLDRFQTKLDTRVGAGAFVNSISQTRDIYLDIRYRTDVNNVGASTAKLEGLNQIADVLDEVGRGDDDNGILESRLNELVEQMQRLNTQGAGRDEYDSLLREKCDAIVNTLHSYATSLETQRVNLETSLYEDVEHVNGILTRIRDLNSSIAKTELFDGNALEQRDERDLLLDELATYMDIDVTYETEWLGEGSEIEKLVVRTADPTPRTLINGSFGVQFNFRQIAYDAEGNVIDDPVANKESIDHWEDNDTYQLDTGKLLNAWGQVYKESNTYVLNLDDPNMPEDMQSIINDIYFRSRGGEDMDAILESIRVAHQNDESGYKYFPTDIFDSDGYHTEYSYEAQMGAENKAYIIVTTNRDGQCKLKDTELHGSILSKRELLTEKGVFTPKVEETALEYDAGAYLKRGIPYYQKMLDLWANDFAYTINSYNDALDTEHDPPQYGPLISNNALANTTGSTSSTTSEDPPIDATNISISFGWATTSFRVKISDDEDLSTDNSNLNKLLVALTTDHKFCPQSIEDGDLNADAFSTDVFFTGTFQELLTNHMVGNLAQDIEYTSTMLSNFEESADDIFVERDGVMGVDLNDEAMNLMQLQKAYTAACKLMTIYDSMLEKLINS